MQPNQSIANHADIMVMSPFSEATRMSECTAKMTGERLWVGPDMPIALFDASATTNQSLVTRRDSRTDV